MKPQYSPKAFRSTSRFGAAILLLSFVTIAGVPGCVKGSGSGPAELDEDLFSERVGESSSASYWVGNLATGAGAANLVFFEDGTGQVVLPAGGGFAPGGDDGVMLRTFYSATWEVDEEDEVTMSLDDVDYEFDLRKIDVSGDGDTFTARYVDDDDSTDFDFTRQPGGIFF